VERWFEKFEYEGPRDGHPSWSSTFFREDGSVASRWEYVCDGGLLLVTADGAPGFTRHFELNVPVIHTEGGTADSGLVEIAAGDLVEPGRWPAASRSQCGAPTFRETPAGDFTASQVETLVHIYDGAGEQTAVFYLSVWFQRAPDLVPITRTWFEYSGGTSVVLGMELISVRRVLDL